MVEFLLGLVESSAMGLNIKTEEAHKLAKRLAEKTGESMTTAVTKALQERLARVERAGMAEDLLKIAESYRAATRGRKGKPMTIEDLYDDETGLPK